MLSCLSSIGTATVWLEQLAMLSQPDTAVVKDWLASALLPGNARGVTRTGLAQHCEVSRQAVNGWITTGRISKAHLSRAVSYVGSAPDFLAAPAKPTPLFAAQPEARYRTGWPFPQIDPAAVAALDAATLGRLENIILTAAELAGVQLVKNKRGAA